VAMPTSRSSICFATLALILLLGGLSQTATAQPMTIKAYQSQYAVNVHGPYQASQWSDTPMIVDPTSGMTFAIKQNGTGLVFLMIWNQSATYCSDTSCFGAIELGYQNNTLPMGSPTTPTTMILASPSFKGSVEEFIATGESTPVTVESKGYATQTVCGLILTADQYTAECYRPFQLSNASPEEVNLAIGSTVEIAFAVGEFSEPGVHGASNMVTYVLTISSETYSPSVSTTWPRPRPRVPRRPQKSRQLRPRQPPRACSTIGSNWP
jgi:hypothetical protein